MAKIGWSVHVTTISQALRKADLYGRVEQKKPLLKSAMLSLICALQKNT